MIELNLLPDVKLQFIKARRIKRLIVSVSFISSAAALVLFIFLLMFVDVFQKNRINTLNSQIQSSQSQLQGNSNLNKILTIQKQLKTLPAIDSQVPVSDRLYGYLSELIPSNATISTLALNYTTNNIEITGTADKSATVNQMVDTVKFATYSISGSSASYPAFTTINVNSITIASGQSSSGGSGSNNNVDYDVSFNFDPKIFNPLDNVQLVVPSITSTRSILNQPTDLFKSNKG